MLTNQSKANGATFLDYLQVQRQRVDAELSAALDAQGKGEKIVEASRYSLMLPSKRLRPLLCLEVSRALSGADQAAMPAALALEMIHSYSLVHDDLPCMDNDDLRRGMPTNHKVYGDGTATLVGDGLLTLAFEVLASAGSVSDATRVAWTKELAIAAGIRGMVLGQQWDMETVRESSVQALEALHRRKTGALIASSAAMGAIAAGASKEVIDSVRQFALDLGLAFQIRDDILDVIGGAEIGKPLKSDERNQKPTYVSVLGLERAKEVADEWATRCLTQLRAIEFKFENRLEDFARFVIERKV